MRAMRVPTALGGAWVAALLLCPSDPLAVGGALALAVAVLWTEVGR